MSNKGVTIIELGVVIVLIGLIAILLSPFVRIIRDKSRQVRCINNLQEISLGLREYALENNEKPPQHLGLIATQGYVDSERVFDCPFSLHKGNAKDPDYNYIESFDFSSSENPGIVYDKSDNHKDGTVNVLYLSGKIESVRSGTMAE